MGRRNQHSAVEFDKLVFGQIETFLADSPADQLSLRKVATLIGYAPSTLVSVYGSYADLLLRINARTLELLNQQLTQVIDNKNLTPHEKLSALAMAYFDFATVHTHRWQLIFTLTMPTANHATDEMPLPQWIQSAIDYSFDLLVNCLEVLNPQKSLEQRQIASRVLWSGVHGITVLSLADKLFLNQHCDGEVLITSLVENMLLGWAGKPVD